MKIWQDQASTFAFLRDPATHGVQAADISTVETHISLIVLTPDRAFKLKRAVRLRAQVGDEAASALSQT